MPVSHGAIVITGLKEIDRRLKRLAPAVQKKVVRKAMRQGLKIIKSAVEAEAPVDTGTTRSKVKVRAVKSRRRGSISLEVRIEADDDTKKTGAKTGKTVFYPAIVQYGREGVEADEFMTRAFDGSGERARQATIDALRRGVEREAAAGGGGTGGGAAAGAGGGPARDPVTGRFM